MAIAAAAPNLSGTESQRTIGGIGRPAGRGGAPTKTATFPLNCAGLSTTVVSPQRPAKTVGTFARSALPLSAWVVEGAIGIQSVLATSDAMPATSRDDTLSKPAGPNARSWNQVPLSPAGLSPSRLNSRAM